VGSHNNELPINQKKITLKRVDETQGQEVEEELKE
jgi:hypothetical protein